MELRELVAKVEELSVVVKGNCREIEKIKRNQERFGDMAWKVEEIDEVVKENSSEIMEHADAIRTVKKTTKLLVKKVQGAL